MSETCEYRRPFEDVEQCAHPAIFLVRVGTRKTDAQRSCARHLARTCRAMTRGDTEIGSAPKALTVIMTGVF